MAGSTKSFLCPLFYLPAMFCAVPEEIKVIYIEVVSQGLFV
jgi:hypothetical protein